MNRVGIIGFVVVFFGLCGGFLFFIWRASQNKNEQEKPGT